MPPTPEKLRVSGAWLRSRDMVSFRARAVMGESPLALKTPRKCKPGVGSGEAGVRWGVGGEGAGGCGHALAAFKYSQNT